MKRQLLLPLAALLWSLSQVSLAAEPASRPAGVSAENWVQVSDRLGIVLSDVSVPVVAAPRNPTTGAQSGGPLLLKPPVSGYFMVKTAGGWTRLVIAEPIKGPADVG